MKYTLFSLAVLSLLIFNCTEISPNQLLLAGFVTFLIPVALLINFAFFFFYFYKENYLCLIPLIVLVVGFKYIVATFAINFPQKNFDQPNFSVLSYNLSFFSRGDFDGDLDPELDRESDTYKALKWIINNDADVKCFQEFYHRNNTEMFETLEMISQRGKYDYYFSSQHIGWEDAETGITIFSKHPIVNSGEVVFKENSVNRAAFADITLYGDTIRFINVHLESMNLKPNHPLESKSLGDTKDNFISIFEKLAKGQIDRSFQARMVGELIHQSPYKVILLGDFNQTPYSYVYNSFKKFMHNAFERAGTGFGFTYSGNTLFFLRIDHQFYNPKLKAVDFKTYNDVPYSDHFPIEATYVFNEK